MFRCFVVQRFSHRLFQWEVFRSNISVFMSHKFVWIVNCAADGTCSFNDLPAPPEVESKPSSATRVSLSMRNLVLNFGFLYALAALIIGTWVETGEKDPADDPFFIRIFQKTEEMCTVHFCKERFVGWCFHQNNCRHWAHEQGLWTASQAGLCTFYKLAEHFVNSLHEAYFFVK